MRTDLRSAKLKALPTFCDYLLRHQTPIEMVEGSISPIVQQTYTDIDEFESTFNRQQDFHVMSLDFQPLRCDLLTLQLKGATFSFRQVHHPLRILGNKRSDWCVFEFLILSSTGSLISHDTIIHPDTLYGFDSARGIDMVLPANTRMASLSIQQTMVQDYLQIMDRADLDDRFWATNAVQDPTRFVAVQDYLRDLYGLVSQRAPFLAQAQISQLLLDDYLPLLLNSIPHKQRSFTARDRRQTRIQLVRQTEEYLLANLGQPLTLKDLCVALNISKTPLNYGFQEVFGVSPMVYLKLLRLRAIHTVLKTADPDTKIVEIAHQFGFWHMGRFSQEYKQMFGELPSVTRRRK